MCDANNLFKFWWDSCIDGVTEKRKKKHLTFLEFVSATIEIDISKIFFAFYAMDVYIVNGIDEWTIEINRKLWKVLKERDM